MKSRRLVVLLITKNSINNSHLKIFGNSEINYAKNSELEHYVELLSAANIPFEIINYEDISGKTFIDGDEIKYAAIIVALPFSSLSNDTFSILKEVSYKFGISIITSYTNSDEKSNSLFGIRNFRGKRLLWPLKVKIVCWPQNYYKSNPVVEYGLSSGLSGLRKRGLGKLDIKQTFIKVLKLVRSMIIHFALVELEQNVNVLATDLKSRPLVWSFYYGAACNYYFAIHGAMFLNKYNEMHRLFRTAILANSGFGMVYMNLENTMVLRLDDPGACANDYLDSGGILEENDWEELGNFLKSKEIPLTVVYTPGWVDDGDAKSGTLYIDGMKITNREYGKIYDSAKVKYIPFSKKDFVYDHSSEFKGLQKLVKEGLVDIQSHGLTHLVPDYEPWSKAADKNRNTYWYCEFFHVRDGKRVKKDKQLQAMIKSRNKIQNFFEAMPFVITPSGHRHDPDCDLLTLDAGFLIFSANYTGILKNNNFIRNWKIASPFLYLKDPTPFASKSGYPVVGVVHDYEIKEGLKRFEDIIENWIAHGIKRFISMRDLTAALCSSLKVTIGEFDSQMSITLQLPTIKMQKDFYKELAGAKLPLNISLPENRSIAYHGLSVSGADLLAFEQDNNAGVASLYLKITGEPTVKIKALMQSENRNSEKYVKK